jgi:UDP-N-acetylglucosamine--N-acetylmuramyl-(pentapeptide) pyrophosphoryl-undecaprenol N-acetylglucosamine transferase
VAYGNMEKYFPENKLVLTGNPVRTFQLSDKKKAEAKKYFSVHSGNPVLLILGGSLGARSINNCLKENLEMLGKQNVEVIWQTGKIYCNEMKKAWEINRFENIRVYDFISRMDLAYNIADVLISRAGASTISEICILGKPAILVPSPNVAEDHQTKNAMALVDRNAARIVTDKDAGKKLINEALILLNDKKAQNTIGTNCKKMALPEAAEKIVDEILKLVMV